MYIVPLSGVGSIGSANNPVKTEDKSASFADVFKQALDNVEQTQKIVEEDSQKVALGEIDNLHEIQINSEKAALALETFVAMKNTAIDAFNELMRTNV